MEVAGSYEADRLREAHRRLNADAPAGRIRVRDGVELALAPASRVPFEAFCLDPSMTREMDSFLRASGNRRRLLDIGAMHGMFSLAFTARPGTSALAVEPSPPALAGLRANCRLNPRHHVRIVEAGAGATASTIRMRHDGIHLVGADLISDETEPTLVRVVAGDDLIADQRFAPDMIKLDVEGYEQQVLTGLANTLDCFRPDLHIEVHGPWLPMFDGSAEGVVRLLWAHGYRLRVIGGQEVSEADLQRLDQQMFHLSCTHRSTEWADRVRGCG